MVDFFKSAIGCSYGRSYTYKYGVKDRLNNIIIPPRFDSCREFKNGFAAVRIGNLWGFVREDGLEITCPTFDKVEDFESGVARVTKNSLMTLLGENGKIISPFNYYFIGEFYNNHAPAKLHKNGARWSIIDTSMHEVVSDLQLPHDGYTVLSYDDGYILSYCSYSDEDRPTVYYYTVYNKQGVAVATIERNSCYEKSVFPKRVILDCVSEYPECVYGIKDSLSRKELIQTVKPLLLSKYTALIGSAQTEYEVNGYTNEFNKIINTLESADNISQSITAHDISLSSKKSDAIKNLKKLVDQ